MPEARDGDGRVYRRGEEIRAQSRQNGCGLSGRTGLRHLLMALATLVALSLAGAPVSGATAHAAARTVACKPRCPAWVATAMGGYPDAMALSPNGSRIFAAVGQTVVAYAANGAQIWSAQQLDSPGGVPVGIAVSPLGTEVFFSGTYDPVGGPPQYLTVAYDAASGAVLWKATYDGLDSGPAEYSIASAITASPDGSEVYVTGSSGQRTTCGQSGGTCNDYATVAYSATTGSQLWSARYDDAASGDDEATALAVSPDGMRLFVTGFAATTESASEQDITTIAYATAQAGAIAPGTPLWTTRVLSGMHGRDQAVAIGVSPDSSRVFVAGNVMQPGLDTCNGLPDFDFATVAIDAVTGTQRWQRLYTGVVSANNAVAALAVDKTGEVVVTGHASGRGGDCDMRITTIAYATTNGSLRWLSQYRSLKRATWGNWGMSVSASLDGSRIYVTGATANKQCNLCQYATLAYDSATGHERWVALYSSGASDQDLAYACVVSPDGAAVYVTGFFYQSAAPGGYELATLRYAT